MYKPAKGQPVICVMYSLVGAAGGPRYSAPCADRAAAEAELARLQKDEATRIYGERVVTLAYSHYKAVGPYHIVRDL